MLMNYGKQGYRKLKNYIETSVLPSLLTRSHFEGFNKRQVSVNVIIRWEITFKIKFSDSRRNQLALFPASPKDNVASPQLTHKGHN